MKRKNSDFWQQMNVANQIFLQHVDRRDIAATRRGMEHMNENGIREFVLNSLRLNTIMSKSHGHGLPPIVRKVKDMRFNGNIICKKAWYKIHNIPQSTFYNYQHNFDKDM